MGEKDELSRLSKDGNDLLKNEKSSSEEFLRSAAYAALKMPYEGVAQIVNKMAQSQVLPETEISRPEPAQLGSGRWLAQNLGTAIGALPWVVAIGKGVQVAANPFISRFEGDAVKLAGLKMSSTTLATGEAAVTGGIYSGLLQPSLDPNNFWSERGTNAAVGAATLGAFGFGMSKFNLPDSASRLTRVGAAATTGLGAGFVNAESSALFKEQRMASPAELINSMTTYGSLGAAMGAFGGPEAMTKPKELVRNAEPMRGVSENMASVSSGSFNRLVTESHKLIDAGKTAEAASTLDNLSSGLKARAVKTATTADEFMELGTAFRRLGTDYNPQARTSFHEAMGIYQNGGARAQAADAAQRLAMLEESAGNYGKAADWLNTSLSIKSDAAGQGILNRAEASDFRQSQSQLYDKLEHLYRKAGNNDLADKVKQSRPLPEAPIDYQRLPKDNQ